jgi:DNA-binding NarL/FixJ family response regulator
MAALAERVSGAPVRVLIADDIDQVRADLRQALELAGGLQVVGEAADGQAAVTLAERLQPDVVLMDLEMPVLDGYQAARHIKERCPACRVVALTVHGGEASRLKAFEQGVDAFIVKGTTLQTLVDTITQGDA